MDRPHTLVVGPRGSGKTHLLRVVTHEARGDASVTGRLAVVTLPEDAPEIVSYQDLLFSVVERLLDDGHEAAKEILADARGARRDATRLEQVVLRTLGDRVLVLVIENLDRVFQDFGAVGQSRLRSFTENSQQVMLLASTPLLFDAISSHARPWYGAFNVEVLDDLTAEQGGALLEHLAIAAGDDALAEFLRTPTAHSRLQAVTHLTGGSPRMWTVLAGCVTVELLDELVPLVKALLDELVPYYQERLNSLAGNERKLVVELCRTTDVTADGRMVHTAHGMRTVRELAEICGLDAAVAASSLNRLHDARWVRRSKQPGTDQRTTWYEIREPMLRHHLQYRDSRGELLRVIVSFLREWYSLAEQRQRLAFADPGSLAEEYFRSVLAENRITSTDAPYDGGDPVALLAGARCWLDEPDAPNAGRVMSRLAALAAEAAALTVIEGAEAARAAADVRLAGSVHDRHELERTAILAAIDSVSRVVDDETAARARVGAGLDAAVGAISGRADLRDEVALELLAAGWTSRSDPNPDALARLERLRSTASPLEDNALRLAVDAERAFALWQTDDESAYDAAIACFEERVRLLGADHPDTVQIGYAATLWGLSNGDRMADVCQLAVRNLAALERLRSDGDLWVIATRLSLVVTACATRRWALAAEHGPMALESTLLGEFSDSRIAPLVVQAYISTGDHRTALITAARIVDDDPASAAPLYRVLKSTPQAPPLDMLDHEIATALAHAIQCQPTVTLACWAHAVADLDAGAMRDAAAHTINAAEVADASQHLLPALLLTADLLQQGNQFEPWLAAWEQALVERDELSLAHTVVVVLREAFTGNRTGLAELPADLRGIIEDVVDGRPIGEDRSDRPELPTT